LVNLDVLILKALTDAPTGPHAAGAWLTARVLPRFVESAQPDLTLIGWVAIVLIGAAVVAMIVPIRRALGLNPIDAMRA
jgi:hypothetical protein